MRLMVSPAPTVEQAYQANQELIHLQQVYPMLGTMEERENNRQRSDECQAIISHFILTSYLQSTGSKAEDQ